MGTAIEEPVALNTESPEKPLLKVIFPYYDDTGESILSLTEYQPNTPD